MSAALRRLRAADAGIFRTLRLEALAREPSAFGAALEEEARHEAAVFATRLEELVVLGAFATDGALLGMAGFRADPAAKRRHIGYAWGVYVRAEARGQGLGRRLVEAVVAAARGRVTHLRLSVNAANAPARQLYEALGFRAYGTEPAALRVDGRFHDELLMNLDLD